MKRNSFFDEIPEFHIVGVSIVTENREDQFKIEILKLFKRFFDGEFSEIIKGKISKDIYCLYTDYDVNGFCTIIVGCKVRSFRNVIYPLVCKKIARGYYQVFVSKGKVPDSIFDTWDEISRSCINRGYIADFDVYKSKDQNLEYPKVKTYVSVTR